MACIVMAYVVMCSYGEWRSSAILLKGQLAFNALVAIVVAIYSDYLVVVIVGISGYCSGYDSGCYSG